MRNKNYSIKNLVNQNQANFDSPNYIASGAAGAGGLAAAGGLANTYRRQRGTDNGFLQQLNQDVRSTGSGINQEVRRVPQRARIARKQARRGFRNVGSKVTNPINTAQEAGSGIRNDFQNIGENYNNARGNNAGRLRSAGSAAKRFARSNTGKVGLGTTLLGLSAAGLGALRGDDQ